VGIHPFHRLQTELEQLILSLPVDARLPSEPQLARNLGVSRATLREAMRAFEGRGMIRRRQGVGTFVTARPAVMDSGLEVLESLETIAQRSGLTVHMGELSVEHVSADATLAEKLELPPGAEVIRISRIIHADNRPVAFLVDALPADILSDAELAAGFTGSVLDLLLRRGNPRLVQSRTEVNAIGASQQVAHALQIQREDVLLYFTAQLYSEEGRAVDFSHSYFLPGYYRFHIVRRVG
jgi:GntR family transcriptional regulator